MGFNLLFNNCILFIFNIKLILNIRFIILIYWRIVIKDRKEWLEVSGFFYCGEC